MKQSKKTKERRINARTGKGAMESATTLIGGIAARVQAAIDKAVAGGASVSDLAPVQAEVDALNTDAAALSAAVTANS